MNIDKYNFNDESGHDLVHPLILPAVRKALKLHLPQELSHTICDLGCGYGKVADQFNQEGWSVLGLDPSSSGIDRGRKEFPGIRLEQITGDEDLAAIYGTFSVVLSIEVVEHVFSPKSFIKQASDLVAPRGLLIMSTPYHSYLKYLALALTGKMNAHVDPLWEGGHIKFWSPNQLKLLGESVGLNFKSIARVGRIPPLAKSMVVTWQKNP
jgi:2-polyprenyl-6-hydroxyphenyl methylase/3-demethylubiquinone-9 3-methyltransferase